MDSLTIVSQSLNLSMWFLPPVLRLIGEMLVGIILKHLKTARQLMMAEPSDFMDQEYGTVS